MTTVKEVIRAQFPTIDEMPFCAALRDGKFDRAAILRAEIVELYRALYTRHSIQDSYKEKLQEALQAGIIETKDVDTMEEVIDDEGETEDHIDHLDMRFKLFVGTPVSRATDMRHNDKLEAINQEWMTICKEADLLTMMSFTAAIEDWYAPLSEFFENEYRKRGFSDDELELFIVHKGADIEHSEAQFDILERNKHHMDLDKIAAMVRRTFGTSKAYDGMKLELAESSADLSELVEPINTTRAATA